MELAGDAANGAVAVDEGDRPADGAAAGDGYEAAAREASSGDIA